jgi:hypothetical protein
MRITEIVIDVRLNIAPQLFTALTRSSGLQIVRCAYGDLGMVCNPPNPSMNKPWRWASLGVMGFTNRAM